MKIKKAVIHNYGQFTEREFVFSDGINVIQGDNEAGKSTLQIFLLSMLFGMDKPRGRSVGKDDYSRYEPWNAPGFYAGELEFEVGGRTFLLERNFYHKEKSTRLVNLEDGEELSVEFGDLSMLLGGMTRGAFENTCFIRQAGFATGKDFPEIFREYMTNAASSGERNLPVNEALADLNQRKKQIQAKEKELGQARLEKLERIRIRQEILSEDLMNLKAQAEQADMQAEQADMQAEDADTQAEQADKRTENTDKRAENAGEYADAGRSHAAGTGGIRRSLIFAGFAVISAFICVNVPLVRIPAGIIMLILLGLATWNFYREQYEVPKQNLPDGKIHAVAQTAVLLREQIREKEISLQNLGEEEMEVQKPVYAELEAKEEEEALETAINTIERIALEFYNDLGDHLNGTVSGVLAQITADRYDELSVDENMKAHLWKDGREIPLSNLSRGTLEQIFFAMRMGIGRFFTEEEIMPYFLDETFAMYDNMRLQQVLRFLAGEKRQIFLFSCMDREEKLLEQLEIPFYLTKIK